MYDQPPPLKKIYIYISQSNQRVEKSFREATRIPCISKENSHFIFTFRRAFQLI